MITNIISKKIITSIERFLPMMPIPKTGSCGIVTFAGHNYVQYLIITLMSFFYQTHKRFPCTVIGDGSLTKEDMREIQKKFPGIQVIQSPNNATLKKILGRYPYCMKYRFSHLKDKFNIKLFDPFLLTSYEKIIYMDCDIIFQKFPLEIIEWVQSKKIYALISSEYAFRCTVDDHHWDIITRMFIAHMHTSMNISYTSGLFCLYKKHYTLDVIERALSYIFSVNLQETWTPEQFSLGVMLSDIPHKTLPRTYAHVTKKEFFQTHKAFLEKEAICVHTAFQAKPFFYPKAIQQLIQTHLFQKIL